MRTPNFFPLVLLNCVAIFSTRADSPIRPGDHVAIVGNTFADQLRMHGYLETMLLLQWPENPVSVRNLGWAGDMLTARDRPSGFPTEELTLRAHETDVIVACFGMGESFRGEAGIEDFKRDLNAFMQAHTGKSYNGHSAVRLVLVTPIAYEELGELTPAHESRDHELAMYSLAMSKVAADAGVPCADLFQPSRYLMDEPVGPNFTTNGIHLNQFGYWAISHILHRQLVTEDQQSIQQPWQLFIDADAKTASTRGVQVTGLDKTAGGLTFRVTELTSPTLPPPTDQPLPPQLVFQRDTLKVSSLPPGSYKLSVDGHAVATASHEAWGEGLAIDASPAHKIAEEFYQRVNDKNLQFTYSWKALNQVHIVGERKTSPSGRALPQEVVEFDNLANERDAALRGGIERKTREWRLTRVAE